MRRQCRLVPICRQRPAVSETFPIAEPQPDPADPSLTPVEPDPATTVEAAPAAVEKPPAPSAPPIADLSANACALKLAELFPAVFSVGAAKPLKLRIQADIQQRSPGIFTRKTLSNFLHRHTTSSAYLRALANGESRIDLDGQAAGEISVEHRDAALAEIERRRGLHEARRAAEREAQRTAQREAQQKAMREHAEQADARRERAAVLRAFESTTLTLANFCALKSISQADLEATLARARQDREQAPREPAPAAQQRQPPGDGRDDRRRQRPGGHQRQGPRPPQSAPRNSR